MLVGLASFVIVDEFCRFVRPGLYPLRRGACNGIKWGPYYGIVYLLPTVRTFSFPVLSEQVRFLWKDVGVSEEDLPRVLQTFPLLFALPLSRMQDVVSFLAEDLTINGRDVAKIIRCGSFLHISYVFF